MPHDKHEINRNAWNQIVDIHWDHPSYRVKDFLQGWSNLKDIELDALGDVNGRSMLHLMCQFGLDTLCWVRRGAVATGVDISDKSIERAEQLKGMARLDARFIRSDVLDLKGKIDKKFDIVFQSNGTLCWLADLKRWAKVIAHHLKPGGTFFIVDGHPMLTAVDDDFDYLQKEGKHFTESSDYCDRDFMIDGGTFEYQHSMADIINSMVHAGLQIQELQEYDKCYWQVEENWVATTDGYWTPPDGPPKYPMLFSLKAKKPE